MKISEEFKKRLLNLDGEKNLIEINKEKYSIFETSEENYYDNYTAKIVRLGEFIYLSKDLNNLFNKEYFLYLDFKSSELKFFKKESSKTGNDKIKENNKPKIKDVLYFKNKEIEIKEISMV